MTYTATQLITKSWKLSGVVSKDIEFVTGEQLTDGVDLLNAVLAVKTANIRLIPYYTVYDSLTLVAGQEEYFIPNLISVQTMTFFIGTVRYSMIPEQRKFYFGNARVNNINSLPYMYRCERTIGGMNIFLYFEPEQNYPTEIVGKFSISPVSLNQDLSLLFDAFYIEYLRYALAEYMAEEYNITFQPQSAKKLLEYESIIAYISQIDLQMSKMSTLQSTTKLNYADVNIGHGFRP